MYMTDTLYEPGVRTVTTCARLSGFVDILN
jgi:hypothetical protein